MLRSISIPSPPWTVQGRKPVSLASHPCRVKRPAPRTPEADAEDLFGQHCPPRVGLRRQGARWELSPGGPGKATTPASDERPPAAKPPRATRPGVEPGTREPKSLVLPITPPGRIRQTPDCIPSYPAGQRGGRYHVPSYTGLDSPGRGNEDLQQRNGQSRCILHGRPAFDLRPAWRRHQACPVPGGGHSQPPQRFIRSPPYSSPTPAQCSSCTANLRRCHWARWALRPRPPRWNCR